MRKILIGTLLLIIGLLEPMIQAAQTVLVTGANRGMGLEYAKQLKASGYEVIGTARKPASATELNKLGVDVVQLDVTSADSVAAMAQALEGRAIDMVINNAGYLNRNDSTLETVDFEIMERTLAINTLGPLRVIKALMPNLMKGERKTVINISSQLGSINNSRGGLYSYRTSKAALNMINKNLSAEYGDKGFIFAVIHPGWVQTDMGGPNATYTVKDSISNVMKVVEGLTKADNGKFYDLKGEILPW